MKSLFDAYDTPKDLPVDPKPAGKTKKAKPVKEKPRVILYNGQPFKYVPGLLALDIATKTGFCCATASGVWDLAPKRNESSGMRLIRLKAKLSEICQMEKITLITHEQIAVYGKFPNIVGLEMIGVMKHFAEENKINVTAYMPTQIKQYATGDGKADKQVMLSAARAFRPSVIDDNEADAFFLYHLTVFDLGL